MDENVAAALGRIPLFKDAPRHAISCGRLGGLTNQVFKITLGADHYVLRIPGDGTGDYIDRKVEAHNARVAADAEVGAEVLYFAEGDGLMLVRYLDGCLTMSPALFKSRPGAPARAAAVLKRIHGCGKTFRFRFELFAMIDEYLAVLSKMGARLPAGYHDAVAEAEAVRRVLDARPAPLAPCHCDPLAENFMDNGQRMWVVDWEYSGLNDPLWDLGDVSVEAGFDAAQDRELLEAYCGGAVRPAVQGRMIIYKAMCDLLWTLWGLIQHAKQNPADDFWAYSIARFERCTALMSTVDFAAHLEAVQGDLAEA